MEEQEELTGVVTSVMDFGSIVKVIVTLDPGQKRAVTILNFDRRMFYNAHEDGLDKGARVAITNKDGEEAIRLE